MTNEKVIAEYHNPNGSKWILMSGTDRQGANQTLQTLVQFIFVSASKKKKIVLSLPSEVFEALTKEPAAT